MLLRNINFTTASKATENFHFSSTTVLKERCGRFGKTKEFEFGNCKMVMFGNSLAKTEHKVQFLLNLY